MTAASVTVYTKTPCVQCNLTKAWLNGRGIEFVTAELAEERHLAFAKSLGHLAAPVVLVESADGSQVHWSGFRPDLLGEHLDRKADAA